MIAVRMGDERERDLPALGFIDLEDTETGDRVTVNTSNPDFRAAFGGLVGRSRTDLDRTLRRSKVDVIDIETGQPYVKALMRFFQERMRRRR